MNMKDNHSSKGDTAQLPPLSSEFGRPGMMIRITHACDMNVQGLEKARQIAKPISFHLKM